MVEKLLLLPVEPREFETIAEHGELTDRLLSIVARNHPAPQFLAVSRVEGESMQPALHPGDLIVIDRSAFPRQGRIVVAMVNGRRVVKRLSELRGRMLLNSDHSGYPSLDLTDYSQFEFKGVVIAVVRELH